MTLAVVETLYESNAADIVTMLREMADRIEAQDDGDDATVSVVAVEVSDSKALRIFGFGRTEIYHSIGVLTTGASRLAGQLEDGDTV